MRSINAVRAKLVDLEDRQKKCKLCKIEIPKEENQNNGRQVIFETNIYIVYNIYTIYMCVCVVYNIMDKAV